MFPRVAAAESCPSREAVDASVRTLLARSHAETSGLDAKFNVDDQGDRYTVTVLDRSRIYSDEARDCDKRTEVAAVFIALTLAPPDIANPEAAPPAPPARKPEPPPPPPPPRPPSPPIPRRPLAFEFELGGRAALAPRSSGSELLLGGEASGGFMLGGWGARAFAEFGVSSGWELAGVALDERRIALGALARREVHAGRLLTRAELGPVLHLISVGLSQAEHAATLRELGVRAGVSFGLDTRISPYAAMSLEFLPGAHGLEVSPRGNIGASSSFWLGISAGLVAKFP